MISNQCPSVVPGTRQIHNNATNPVRTAVLVIVYLVLGSTWYVRSRELFHSGTRTKSVVQQYCLIDDAYRYINAVIRSQSIEGSPTYEYCNSSYFLLSCVVSRVYLFLHNNPRSLRGIVGTHADFVSEAGRGSRLRTAPVTCAGVAYSPPFSSTSRVQKN